MNTCTLTKIWTKRIDYYLPLRYETSSVGRLVRRVEQVELGHPTKKVNEIEIQYTMKHELRNVQVIDTITCINWDMHN